MPPQVVKAGDGSGRASITPESGPATNTRSVESAAPAEKPQKAEPQAPKQDPKAAEKNAEGSKQHATEQKGQHDVRGQYLKEQLEAKFQNGGRSADGPGNEAIQNAMRDTGAVYAAPPSTSPQTTSNILYPQEIRDVQQSINQSRANNGKPPIKVTGSLDTDTERAVKEFQKESGIKPANGRVDVATRERLSLENDQHFQTLPDSTKKGVRDYMNSLGQDQTALRSVKGLVTQVGFLGHASVFDTAGFRNLDKNTKISFVKELEDFANNPSKAHNLTTLVETPGFDRISADSRRLMVNTLLANPDNKQFVEDFRTVLDAAGFDHLPNTTRDSMLHTLARHPGDTQVGWNLKILTQHEEFQRLNEYPEVQDRLLRAFAKNPNGEFTVDNLLALRRTPGYAHLNADIQDQLHDAVASNSISFNPARLTNLMTLASASDFQKIQPEIRDFMLSTLGARPDKTVLAEALRDLANDRRFQDEPRSQRKAIMDLDDRIR